MTYTVKVDFLTRDAKVILVGCGGTGSLVAEGLCRLFIGKDIPILLVDHDRVEPPNLLRQNFYPGEVGKFKSQALAERLARQYGRKIGYSVYPFDPNLVGEGSIRGLHTEAIRGLIIGAVDNAAARKEISKALKWGNWWLDAGNGFSSGQVLLGNKTTKEGLSAIFCKETNEVTALPVPSMQLPGLLAPPAKTTKSRDCGEAVATNDQSPTINQAMAVLVVEMVRKIFSRTLTYIGAYLDLEAGSLVYVPAEPVVIARMLSLHVDTLMYRENLTCKISRMPGR